MGELRFVYERIGDKGNFSDINENRKVANELKITVSLANHIEELNSTNSYILVKVAEDGETFQHEIVGPEKTIKYIPFKE